MSDIALRFNKDLLVLSSPIDAALARQGLDAARDRQYLNLMEPEVVRDALRLEAAAGAQCIVAATEDITQARLAHLRMDGDAHRLAHSAITSANEVRPQHVLVEIGPCGLPLDASSRTSLNENRAQYANAARAFEGEDFDAFFLNGFVSIADLKCALMGLAQVGDKPVFASVVVSAGRTEASPNRKMTASGKTAAGTPSGGGPANDTSTGGLFAAIPFAEYEYAAQTPAPPSPIPRGACLSPERWPEAVDVMADFGAAVVGFETSDPITDATSYARTAVERTALPVLAQLRATEGSGAESGRGKNLVPLEDIAEYTPDTMATAAVRLYGAGVQFLRATGPATPAFTGALAATVLGLDVRRRREE